MTNVGRPRLTNEIREYNKKISQAKYKNSVKENTSIYMKERYLMKIKDAYINAVAKKYGNNTKKMLKIHDNIIEATSAKEVRNIIKPHFTMEEYKNIII